MDIYNLLEEFEQIIYMIEDKIEVIDNNVKQGLREIPEVIAKIQQVLPDWFLFIEQTEIGSKELILNILKDITDAIQRSDGVSLADVLIYGMQRLLIEYCEIIKEALNEE